MPRVGVYLAERGSAVAEALATERLACRVTEIPTELAGHQAHGDAHGGVFHAALAPREGSSAAVQSRTAVRDADGHERADLVLLEHRFGLAERPPVVAFDPAPRRHRDQTARRIHPDPHMRRR